MNFLNPLLLAGMIGIASPIIIHLLAKKQVHRVVWAAMKFLRVTVDRNQRKMSLEDIVLLALRCLVLVLLALALARPALRRSTIAVLGSDETAILLLDNSGSMAATDGAQSRFEKAQKAAEQVLDALPGGSAVAVWLVSDVVRKTIPQPTRDLALARRTIREARRSDQGTEWPAALRQAIEVAQRQPGAQKQLYAISDGQAGGWHGPGEIRALIDAAKQDVQTHFVLVTEGETRNLAVTNLRLASALAPVNQPLRFEITVANFGPDEMRDIAVSLATDSDAPSDEQTLPPLPPGGEPKTLSLFATFREPGFHTVTARIHADRCPFDDTRTFALRVVDEVNVLLVDGEPGAEPRDSEVFYLRNALTPVPEEMRERYFIKTKTVAAADLEQLTFRDYEAVVLANVVDLSGPALNSLENYVRLGGGLVVFPGSRISPAFYNGEMHRARPLLPAAFGALRGEPIDETKAERPDKYFQLQGKDYTHRIVEPWKDPKNGTLTSAQFYRAFTLQPPPPGDAPGVAGPPAVVLAFADGAPAVMERTYGHGRVVQFASTADTAWCDLPVRPVFLPLMHRTLGALLARQEEQLNVRAGTMFSHIVDRLHVGHEVTVVEPGAKKETTRPHLLELKDNLPLLEYPGTALGGRYDVFFAEEGRDKLCFAAAPDPKEGDLHEWPAADWQSLSDLAPVIHWTPSVDLRTLLQRKRTGTELWSVLALAALALAAAETLLGNRWSRSR